jgi:trigger factor
VVKLTIAVDEQRTNDLMKRAARTLSRNYRMPGFRPGKAPYNVVVRRVGIESVQAQVLDQFGDQIYQEGLEKSELEPADQASLDDVTWDPFTLHLTVSVAPEVDLGNYAEVRVPWEEPQVSDQDLEEALERMQKEQMEYEPEDRPSELGDRVVMDIKATVEEQVVLENTGRELVLSADSPYPVPGFASSVVGMNPGETREFDLTYPEDHYNADIAGKEGHFVVQLSEIRVEVLPALDDEFAMSVGDYENLEDLRAQLRQSLQEQAERAAENEYEEQLWAKLLEEVKVEYPDVYVDQEVESIKDQLERQLSQQNLELATYFQLSNTTEEAWQSEVRPQAEERLQRRLVLAEVIKDQGLEVSAEEIEAEIETTLEPMGERAGEMREMLESPIGRMSIAETLVARKATERLQAIARGELPLTEGEAEPEEAEAAVADAEAQTEETADNEDASEEGETPAEDEASADGLAEEVQAPSMEEDSDVPDSSAGTASESQ